MLSKQAAEEQCYTVGLEILPCTSTIMCWHRVPKCTYSKWDSSKMLCGEWTWGEQDGNVIHCWSRHPSVHGSWHWHSDESAPTLFLDSNLCSQDSSLMHVTYLMSSHHLLFDSTSKLWKVSSTLVWGHHPSVIQVKSNQYRLYFCQMGN
jgi:hypothetical protein